MTMDYEKLYNDALERAKNYYTKGYFMINSPLEKIFPELKESEDEKIRKALIRFHKSTIDIDGIKGEDIIDWLEKQGEKKPAWSEDDERIVTALMEGFRYHQLFNPRFGEVPNTEIISWIKSLKERLS